MELPTDATKFIESAFPPEQQAAAITTLTKARIEDGTPPNIRLLRCTLIASCGDIRRLQHYAALLAVDWRDVIVAGEYESRGKELIRVRDLDQPIQI